MKLPVVKVAQIKRHLADGAGPSEIARAYALTIDTVSRIKRGKTHRDVRAARSAPSLDRVREKREQAEKAELDHRMRLMRIRHDAARRQIEAGSGVAPHHLAGPDFVPAPKCWQEGQGLHASAGDFWRAWRAEADGDEQEVCNPCHETAFKARQNEQYHLKGATFGQAFCGFRPRSTDHLLDAARLFARAPCQ